MPTLVLLAGPNGAGKTTFIGRVLKRRAETFVFVNPDEVARGKRRPLSSPKRPSRYRGRTLHPHRPPGRRSLSGRQARAGAEDSRLSPAG